MRNQLIEKAQEEQYIVVSADTVARYTTQQPEAVSYSIAFDGRH